MVFKEKQKGFWFILLIVVVVGILVGSYFLKEKETRTINVSGNYQDWTGNVQKLKGYVVSNYIKITLKEFDKVGKVIDVSVDSGALVNYINFELSNEKMNEYKAMALANASQDAKRKAEAIVLGLEKTKECCIYIRPRI